nr:MAG TPA: hypothetical protein [Caudoviricetes sp.]
MKRLTARGDRQRCFRGGVAGRGGRRTERLTREREKICG